MKKDLKTLFIGIAVVAFMGYVVYILISQQPLIDAKEAEKIKLEQLLKENKQAEIELRVNIKTADTLLYIEEVAKKKLGMLKPGERVFIDIKK